MKMREREGEGNEFTLDASEIQTKSHWGHSLSLHARLKIIEIPNITVVSISVSQYSKFLLYDSRINKNANWLKKPLKQATLNYTEQATNFFNTKSKPIQKKKQIRNSKKTVD